MNQNIRELMETVIENDYCSGCGICASLNNSPFTMKLDENGKYKPFFDKKELNDKMESDILSVCPFSNNSKNETEIAESLYNQEDKISFNQYTGYYLKNYAGYVKEGEFRKKGSSGGMGNWIASQLLELNLVDGIIHVKSSNEKSDSTTLFDYQISYTQEELFKGAKSKYYPIEMSQVIKEIREKKGRYALIGIPCFIKGIRLLAESDPVIKECIKFTIALVCGHLKSDMFAKSIGWQLGIEPDKLNSIDFRKKLPDRGANDYGVEVQGKKEGNNVIKSTPTKDLYTTNWGHGYFKYNACEYCDDVLGETADITVGDAWLPEYEKNSMGTNIIIVRNSMIGKILENSKEKIHIEEVDTNKVYQSQASGIRHRREGLAYRLYLKDRRKEWRPQKRIEPSDDISPKRKLIYEKRMMLSQKSFEGFHKAIKINDFNVFITYMNPMIKEYDKLVRRSFVKRAISKLKKEFTSIVK